MARDEEFGRLVVANRDLAVGDVVMEVTDTCSRETQIMSSSQHHVNVKQTIMLDGSKYPRPYMFFLSFQERPLSWAPMLDSPPVCLTCAQFLQKKSYRWELARLLTSRRLLGFEPISLTFKKLFKKRSNSRCPSCGWPMCGSKCAKAPVHRWEKSTLTILGQHSHWDNSQPS